ncbi:MAG TPA: hypothetical protein VNA67_07100 [Pseudonocardiaceae bacterium]|nr:hypothetical protein [Pseudonocardiaceae bacterium]
MTRGRLAGVPVFLAHGVHDAVIPAELQDRTWDYLVQESGSPLWAKREPTGHQVTATTAVELDRGAVGLSTTALCAAARRRGRCAGALAGLHGRDVAGAARRSARGQRDHPQQQESQNAPIGLQEALFSRVAALAGVATRSSAISVPGARAFVLDPGAARGPAEAFMVADVGEFAHLHPGYDGQHAPGAADPAGP